MPRRHDAQVLCLIEPTPPSNSSRLSILTSRPGNLLSVGSDFALCDILRVTPFPHTPPPPMSHYTCSPPSVTARQARSERWSRNTQCGRNGQRQSFTLMSSDSDFASANRTSPELLGVDPQLPRDILTRFRVCLRHLPGREAAWPAANSASTASR